MPITAIEQKNHSGSSPEWSDKTIEHAVNIPPTAKKYNSLSPDVALINLQAVHQDNSFGKRLFISAMEMLSKRIIVRPLIGKLIERGTTGQIFGPPASGKSFVELDMGLCVATGSKWNGHECEQGAVLYFAGEGHKGLIKRIKAWTLKHGTLVEPFFFSSRSTISFDKAGLDKVVAEGLSLQKQIGQPISLIIIDTLARHLQGDENSASDMSAFVRMVDGLRNTFPGSTAIIVHHTGNDAESGRSRGSSALKAACDFEIHCHKGLLTFTKRKDGEKPAPIGFDLIPIEVGIDEDGESITSCSVEYKEHTSKTGEVALTVMERILMELIDDYPELRSNDLKTVFFDKRRESVPNAKQEALKKSFSRCLASLIEKEKIFMDGDIVKAGQGTLPGHSKDMSLQTKEQEDGTDRDIPLKGCPDVPADCLVESADNTQTPEFDWED